MAKRDKWSRWAQTVNWDAKYTCRECGKVGQGHYVQPQPPWAGGGALCADCVNKINRRHREERRKQLAAMPRCEVPDCRARATHYHNGTGLCGRHWKRASNVITAEILAQTGGVPLWIGGPVAISKERLIAAAQR